MISYKDYIFDQIQNNKILNHTSKFYLRLLLQEEWYFNINHFKSSTIISISNSKRIIEISIDEEYKVHLIYNQMNLSKRLSIPYIVYQKELYDICLCVVTNFNSKYFLEKTQIINDIKKYYHI